MRIGVQLIELGEPAPIWTHRFEDTLEDIFDLQDRVALAVASRIETTVQEAEIRRASARSTENLSSYDLYLRAMPPHRTVQKEGIFEALSLLNRAIVLDPDFGQALALAAHCHMVVFDWGWSGDLDGVRREGLDLARRALRASGDDAVVLARAAGVLDRRGDEPDEAITLIDRALALNPGALTAWATSGYVRLRAGDTDLAVAHLETAMRLAPASATRRTILAFMGLGRLNQGRFGEASALLREANQLLESPLSLGSLAACYGHLGQIGEAQEVLARYRAQTSQPIEEFGAAYMRDPTHRRLFLDGIALAEGA